ncbi:SPW repeat domain-containing protein [Allohahella marinimesophila]|uniref:SPW repeat-containing integral membrane domain-containing protein n=1 Tax=Allohahella marinimesophila TaxID=1054972 RepID=A0ABP7NQA0_9GAMM
MKVLDPKVHGVLDYLLAIAFLIAPSVFGFVEVAATVSYVIGVIYLLTSIVTKYPLGLVKLLPFPVHGVLEGIMAAAWIVFPWIFGFADDAAARNFFIIAGVGLLVVVALTDYKGVHVEHSHNTHARV